MYSCTRRKKISSSFLLVFIFLASHHPYPPAILFFYDQRKWATMAADEIETKKKYHTAWMRREKKQSREWDREHIESNITDCCRFVRCCCSLLRRDYKCWNGWMNEWMNVYIYFRTVLGSTTKRRVMPWCIRRERVKKEIFVWFILSFFTMIAAGGGGGGSGMGASVKDSPFIIISQEANTLGEWVMWWAMCVSVCAEPYFSSISSSQLIRIHRNL